MISYLFRLILQNFTFIQTILELSARFSYKLQTEKYLLIRKLLYKVKRNAKGTSRGVTNSGYKYPEGFQVLGEWNEIGCPTYLSSTPTEIDGQLMYNIREVFIKPGGSAAMEDYYPEYIDENVNIEINVKKPTEIGLVMLSSTGTKQKYSRLFHLPYRSKAD